jgi:hypothetical protein
MNQLWEWGEFRNSFHRLQEASNYSHCGVQDGSRQHWALGFSRDFCLILLGGLRPASMALSSHSTQEGQGEVHGKLQAADGILGDTGSLLGYGQLPGKNLVEGEGWP